MNFPPIEGREVGIRNHKIAQSQNHQMVFPAVPSLYSFVTSSATNMYFARWELEAEGQAGVPCGATRESFFVLSQETSRSR